MEKKQAKKLTKKKNGLFVGAIIVFVLGLFITVLGALYQPEAKSYYTLESERNDAEGASAYVDIYYLAAFATEDRDNGTYDYYFAFDENDYVYLIAIEEQQGLDICQQFEDNANDYDFYVRVNGVLMPTFDELEQFAIESLGMLFGEYDEQYNLTMSDYDDYLLHTYLEVGETYDVYTIALGILVCAVGLVMLIISVVLNLINSNKNKQLLEARSELEAEDFYKIQDTYVTFKYLLYSNKGKNTIMAIDDILWIYPAPIDGKRNALVACDKKKSKTFGTFDDVEVINQIIRDISLINPNMLIGFTRENREAYLNLQKAK